MNRATISILSSPPSRLPFLHEPSTKGRLRHEAPVPSLSPGSAERGRFPFNSIAMAVVVATFLLATPSPADVLRVGKITINPEALFPAQQQGLFYRMAGLLHRQTPERLVRRFLLFHEGEPLDEALLRESERNLRALDFLESAAITAGKPHDGVVDVTVTTDDAFTTDANADFSNDGGKSLYDVAVTQKDILGRGGEVDLRIANLRERRTRSLELLDPALFGAYGNGDLLLASSSDGNEERLLIERPLFSYRNRSTFSAFADHLVQDSRIYADGTVASLFRQRHREAALNYGRVIGSTPQRANRLIAGMDLLDDAFREREGQAPLDRRFRFLEAGFDSLAFHYLKLDHIDFGFREQDFNVGPHLSLFAALSPARGSERTIYRFRSDNSFGHPFSEHSFLISRLSGSVRAHAANRNAIVSSDTRVVDRFGKSWPATFAARARIDYGSGLDRDLQFFADGQNGLRAYPNFSFSGPRRVVLNVEQRIFLGHEWLHLFEPGAAVFADSGTAWGSGQRSSRGLRTDAGAGLRLGIARFESTMLRLDIAYAFNDSPTSRRGVVVSFATSQAF